MDYKWHEIRSKIAHACKKTFEEQGVSICITDLESAIDLFDRVVSCRLDFPMVGNLQQDLQHTLQQVFIDNIGVSADLRNVQNLIEAFTKKVIVMAGIKTRAEITGLTLKPLLQCTNVSPVFSAINTKIDASMINQYDKDPNGAYIFCKIYLGRNTVHESRAMDPEDVYRELRYTIAGYILITHHLKNLILANYPTLTVSVRMDLSEINETGYVYDFINYGATSNKIKNRIVESFILNFVYNHSGHANIDILENELMAFSQYSLSKGAIRSVIGSLIPNKLNYNNSAKKEVILNDDESNRIMTALNNYAMLVTRLITEIDNLLSVYGVKGQTHSVYERLKRFFEDNCLSIMNIIQEGDGEASNARSEAYIEDFKDYLRKVGCANERLDEIFKELLNICALNDILVKIALGKKFTTISNPESYINGFKQREKKVYLDTQLLLYALCDFDDFAPYNGSPSFIIVKSLIDIARNNPRIHLATISPYVNEAAYHIKRAVQLITFDDIYYKSCIKLSDNVFYGYYYYLKENLLLNEGVETLSDFLDQLFEVSYDDILQGNFESKNHSYLVDILQKDYGIEVEEPIRFTETEIANSERIFTTVLLNRNDNRSSVAAKKDAIMGLHLFNNEHKHISEPIFLSWDKAFYSYRKDYIKNFIKDSLSSWLLFSPAKFVNHLNLLDMKIDVDVMTEDLISIIEDDDTAGNTKHVLDSINKLLEKSNVNSRQKRKVYSEIIFNETEFPNDTEIPDEKRLKMTNDFAIAFDRMLTMMQTDKYNMSNFANILNDESRFREIVIFMQRSIVERGIELGAKAAFEELIKGIQNEEITHPDIS